MRAAILCAAVLSIQGLLFHVQSSSLRAADTPLIAPENRTLINARLMPLLHSPEIHDELHLKPQQVKDLEAWFEKIDGDWFRSRILPVEDRNKEVDQLEARTREWLQTHISNTQRQRLKQLEWQALGTRVLLRTDFAAAVQMTPAQIEKFASLAQATETARRAARPRGSAAPSADATKALEAAIEAENKGPTSILTPEQLRRLSVQLGEKFDIAKLEHIYPLAPELTPGAKWHNSEPLTLRSLRGQVVLVHFYAFQCHNCQANFPIYRRWQEKLLEKGVVLIGIQTPETKAERDPTAVCKAADENELKFPILLDLESKNWDAWANTMWPTVYVIDKRGYIRHWWQGELNWQGATADKTIEEVVDKCLAEP